MTSYFQDGGYDVRPVAHLSVWWTSLAHLYVLQFLIHSTVIHVSKPFNTLMLLVWWQEV